MPTSTTRTVVSKRLASFTPLLLTLFVFAAQPARAPAQTTAFTYQGQLTEAGTGANGDYDLQFALFDLAAAGTPIGAPQTVPAVPVTSGLFTVQLDFGVNAFPGANRFLEIGVRPTGGGSFTTLAPRQQISSTPYAIRTLSAATADTLSSTCAGCVQDPQIQSVAGSKVSGLIPVGSVPAGSGNYIQNRTTEQPSASFNIAGNGRVGGNLTVDGTLNANVSGNFIQNRTTPQAGANFNVDGNGTVAGTLSASAVGVGTTSPGAKLHVKGAAEGVRIQGTAAGASNQAYATFYDAAGTRIGYVGDGSTNDNEVFLDADLGNVTLNTPAGRVLTATSTGNVGIGTTTPQTKLDVRGDVKLGANGQFFVPGGDENLRIVRGVITSNGSIIVGSGFSVSHDSTGHYTVTFNTQFAGPPAVTVTADHAALAFVNGVTATTAHLGAWFRDASDGIEVDVPLHFTAIGPR